MPADQSNPNFYYSAEGERREPVYRREVINRRMVYAMFSLALLVLCYVTVSVLLDRPHTGQPVASPIVFDRTLTLTGDGNAVVVVDEVDGRTILDTPQGGFVAVVIDGLERARFVASVQGNPPVTLTQYENGRLQLTDPASGWTTELNSFGPGNLAVWHDLLSK